MLGGIAKSLFGSSNDRYVKSLGVIVAKIEPDADDNNCDDSCEWALDGVCDDGSGKGREWWDDDYGGFYGYDDDQYG